MVRPEWKREDPDLRGFYGWLKIRVGETATDLNLDLERLPMIADETRTLRHLHTLRRARDESEDDERVDTDPQSSATKKRQTPPLVADGASTS